MTKDPANDAFSTSAFQDAIPANHCFGCGPENADGLQIKSYWLAAGTAICRFDPQPQHSAGPEQVLNGGIIATLIDCHSICTAIANHYLEENRPIGTDPLVWCVTGGLDIRYVAPTPINQTTELIAKNLERSGNKTVVTCTLTSAGSLCAEARVTAIRVPPEWRPDHAA